MKYRISRNALSLIHLLLAFPVLFAGPGCGQDMNGNGLVMYGPSSSDEGPTIVGLSDDPTPRSQKTWTWGCDTRCEFRFAITTAAVHEFTDEPYGSVSAVIHGAGNGLHYLHVQARDVISEVESPVVSVSARFEKQSAEETEKLSARHWGHDPRDASQSFAVTTE